MVHIWFIYALTRKMVCKATVSKKSRLQAVLLNDTRFTYNGVLLIAYKFKNTSLSPTSHTYYLSSYDLKPFNLSYEHKGDERMLKENMSLCRNILSRVYQPQTRRALFCTKII